MEIVNKIIENKVLLTNLDRGSCFIYGGAFYMKTDIKGKVDFPVIAIKLINGRRDSFGDDTMVMPVDAKVEITRKIG